MRPSFAAIRPSSTTPRPGAPEARVARRASCQMRSQSMASLLLLVSFLWYTDHLAAPGGADMTHLWFRSALLPQGWARDVRLTLAEGQIVGVESHVPPGPGDERHGHALPGLPNLHSHAFQRVMAGLAERRGPGEKEDNFWTWRE